jgi:tetratricopeptide (TPR) repeat protein
MPGRLETGQPTVCADREHTETISLTPCFRSFYSMRGLAYRKTSQYDKSIADFTRAIEMDPTNAWSYYNRGSAYFNKADYPRAVEDFNKAAELDPTMADAIKARNATGRVIFELY